MIIDQSMTLTKTLILRFSLLALLLFLNHSHLYGNNSKTSQDLFLQKITVKEKAYLESIDNIKMCVDPDWLPYEKITKNNEYVGLVAEYIQLISTIIDKEFKVIPTNSWLESLNKAKSRACDILPGSVITPNRKKYMNFSTPYIFIPLVVVTNTDKEDGLDFKMLTDKTLAIIKGYGSIELLKLKYPNIILKEVESAKVGLKMVTKNKVYGYIDSMPTITHQIRQNNLANIKLAATTGVNYNLSIAVRNDDPVLLSIINKAIKCISHEEHQLLFYTWISVQQDTGFNYSLLWKVVLALSTIIATITYWNMHIHKAKRAVEKALKSERKAIAQKLNFIDMISHEYRTPLSVISSCLDIIEEKLPNGLKEQANGIRDASSRLLTLFESSLNNDSKNGKISLQRNCLNLSRIIEATIKLVEYAHEKHNIIWTNRIDSKLEVMGDEELLTTAISNVLDNACKYSDTNSQITVETQLTSNSCIIYIRDTGKGINSSDLSQIFNKYFRANNVTGTRGTGVGLFIVKEITDIHNWKIHVESKVGIGSSFALTIPLERNKE